MWPWFVVCMLSSCFFSGFLKGKEVSVKENSLIQIGFSGEEVKATCQTVFIYNKEHVKFTVSYNWIDSKGNEVLLEQTTVSENVPPDRQNQTETKDYSFTILPTKHNSNTGTYYCKAKWKKKTRKGNGTFIMFRDKGYRDPSLSAWMCLLSITVTLAVLSIVGTVLLFWKRKVLQPWKIKKCLNQGSAPQHTLGSLEPCDGTYTELEPHQSDVYFSIKKHADSPKHEKMASDKVSHQEKPDEITEVYENNSTAIYENF